MVLPDNIVQTYNQKQPKFVVFMMYPKVPATKKNVHQNKNSKDTTLNKPGTHLTYLESVPSPQDP